MSDKSVLYVDDCPQLLRAVKRQLESLGWGVTTAESSTVSPAGYDVALLDWIPSGHEMAQRCVESGVPYVIYTAEDPDYLRNKYKVCDRARILSKPATREQIGDALTTTLIGSVAL